MKVYISGIRWNIEDENGVAPQPFEYEKVREELQLPEEEYVEFDDENDEATVRELVKDYLTTVHKFTAADFSLNIKVVKDID